MNNWIALAQLGVVILMVMGVFWAVDLIFNK